MSAAAPEWRWLVAVLLVSLCVNLTGIGWGLPSDNQTWAADSFQPMAPMAIAKHAFGEGWNSGWFYFKYPLGHPLVLLAAQVPYLAWLAATGQLHTPKSTYPYGFRHPEWALTVLALLTRVVSALMGVGVVALAYLSASRLFGASAGVFAALLTAGCYPIVFYSHTANVDVPLLFWIALAVDAALVCAARDSGRAAAVVGIAVAMALLTKEQSLGALVTLPVVWVLQRSGATGGGRAARRAALIAAVSLSVVTIVVGNLWWNPAGFLNRWRFLLGILPAEIRDAYAPYQFQVQVPKGFSLALERARVVKVAALVAHALTPPVLVLCVAGLLWALWRRPRQAAIPLLIIASYYVVSVRATALVQVRYTMPLLYFFLILGGVAGSGIVERMRRSTHRLVRVEATALLLATVGCALLPGFETVRLLVRDPRYAAEAWLQKHARSNATVETYEPATYLPRFNPSLQVTRVSVKERTVSLLEKRNPDFVVLSSGGRAGLTGGYVRDWQPGKPIIADVDSAKEFFARLRSEQLGYREVGRFRTPTHWMTPRINSLNPEITIYARQDDAKGVQG